MAAHLKISKKSIVWHIKIDSLTALRMKWGQNEEKYYWLIFSSLELYWADLGAHLKISLKVYIVAHQNWKFDCSMNEIGSKWGKKLQAHSVGTVLSDSHLVACHYGSQRFTSGGLYEFSNDLWKHSINLSPVNWGILPRLYFVLHWYQV